MGTRNLTAVYLDGQYKVAQYGQWDGYPSGQGETVLNFMLNEFNVDKFKQALSECRFLSDDEVTAKWKCGADDSGFGNFQRKYPELSRDTAAKVLSLIQNGKAKELSNNIDFAVDSLFCEWAYIIDLDREILEVYEGFNKVPLTIEDRFFDMQETSERKEYYPIKMIRSYKFSELTKHTMTELEESLSNKNEE